MRRSEQFKALRRLFADAGDRRTLNRWITAAIAEKRPRRGRKQKDADFQLFALEALLRVARDPRVSRTLAVRLLVRDMKINGQSEAASVARLYRKLAEPDFRKKFQKAVRVKRYPRPAIADDLIRARNK